MLVIIQLVSVYCVSSGWFLWGVGGGGVGTNISACCSASLMNSGICLYMARNSYGVSMARVSLFWICVIVVMPYMYSLLRYFWVLFQRNL